MVQSGTLSEWAGPVVAVLILLLTTISTLVLARLGHNSRESLRYRKEFETAVQALWDHIGNKDEKSAAVHLEIAEKIGELRAQTTATGKQYDQLKVDFWKKMDNVTMFAEKAKEDVMIALRTLDSDFKVFLMHRENDKK